MRGCFKHRWFRVIAAVAVALPIALLVACWQFNIWSWDNLIAYSGMSRECHPVWNDLNAGRIWKGLSVEEVLQQTQPTEATRFADYLVLKYEKNPSPDRIAFTGLVIIAEGGHAVVARAESCTWERTFFDGWSDERWKSYRRAQSADFKQLAKDQQPR